MLTGKDGFAKYFVFTKIFANQKTCQQGVSIVIVVDYADTTMTTWNLTANCEGFSQMLKEQSGKNVLGCVYIFRTIAIL